MNLPGLHSIHWKVFIFHLAVLLLPVAYLAWQVRLNLEATQLRAAEEGMIDTAAVVGELQLRLVQQSGNDPAKLREVLATMFADFEGNRSTKARLFGFAKEDADTRLIFYDAQGIVLFDTLRPSETGRDDSKYLDVWRALRGQYGSRWERDFDANRVNLFSTLPVWSGPTIAGAVTIMKPTIRSRIAIIRALRELAVPGVAAVGVATLLAYVLSGYLTRIVGGLATRAEAIAQGEPGVTLETWTRSELGTLARAVERMRQRLEGKAYVEEMVTNLSHELKTPLAAIRGAAEVLEDGAMSDPAARAKFLGNIQLEVGRLNQIVDDLLKLSRIESSPAPTPPPMLDLASAARELAESRLAPRAAQLGVTFALRVPDVPIPARISREHFDLLLGNLVTNALQFTPANGSVTVSITAEPVPGSTIIEVADTGAGIEPSLQPKVFQRFFTTENPRTGLRGTGLGLALVRSIVQSARGTIDLVSAPREGSVFRVTLPLVG